MFFHLHSRKKFNRLLSMINKFDPQTFVTQSIFRDVSLKLSYLYLTHYEIQNMCSSQKPPRFCEYFVLGSHVDIKKALSYERKALFIQTFLGTSKIHICFRIIFQYLFILWQSVSVKYAMLKMYYLICCGRFMKFMIFMNQFPGTKLLQHS